ncbi:aminotransferase class V-fold PLP-dependent enzyme [Candidatus Nitronereus thalassa]|uniref:Aminotransferase class V-fold PLP-dependent enzyme n=1 Tax=Candidatus Nitronereus thalassa TaxID=3020898 RepID=A0ABU3K7C6_9BACT|nr:aminotransferase class V-fold PLP-dependent enzyme [Candidatus Nitronereus thalassa]MDT7042253.1 aminotransferase class V-fold PLP-dependent enzyme [Candidatus Nitronereus thalassa]
MGEERYPIAKISEHWPVMIYLNYAALSPTRPEAEQAVTNTLAEFKHYLYSDAGIQWYLGKVLECRQQVSKLLNVTDPSTIAFVSNASTAHYIATRSLQWNPGDAILTSTHENPSITRQFKALAHRGVRIQEVNPSSPDELLCSMSQALDQHPFKAIILSHVSHVDGRIFPIQAISSLARKHGVRLFIDGAQAVGHIPIDLSQLEYDVYFFTGHKWCAGPLGTGAMIVNPRFLQGHSTLPVQVNVGETPQVNQFEIGTQNIGLIAGLAKACDSKYQEGVGTERLKKFRQQAKDLLGKRPGNKVIEWSGPQAPGILTIQGQPGLDHQRLVAQLAAKAGIIVKPFVGYPPDIMPAIRLSWAAMMNAQDFHRGIEGFAKSLG